MDLSRKHYRGIITKFLFLIIILVGATGAFAQTLPLTEVVIDAGSSGTRLYIYQVMPASYPQITPKLTKFEIKSEQGIDDGFCRKNTQGVWVIQPATVQQNYIEEVFKPLLTKIPEYVQNQQVLVSVLATAGMRSAKLNCNATDQQEGNYYNLIKSFISSFVGQNSVTFKIGDVRTIDGDAEEGVWSWINLNDVKRNIFSNPNSSVPVGQPVGVVEVGGSSIQISYPTQNDGNFTVTKSIGGKTYKIFSKTYLGLGQDDARKWLRNMPDPYPSTCWPSGFPASLDLGDEGFPKLKSNGIYNGSRRINCYKLRNSLISSVMSPAVDPRVWSVQADFVGIDGAYYAVSQTTPADIISSPWRLNDKLSICYNVNNFLNTKYFPLTKNGKNAIEADDNTQNYCVNASYIYEFLFDEQVGIFRNNPRQFTTVFANEDKTLPEDVQTILTWTRGYLLQKYGY